MGDQVEDHEEASDVVSVRERNHVQVTGEGPVIVFAHGFGCDQRMWRHVAPRFAADHTVVLFDYVGSGRSDRASYDPVRYGSLDGYATDLLEVLDAVGSERAAFVGHSVSANVGIIAALREPARFEQLVLVAPSPRFIDDPPYVGGSSAGDIEVLLDLMDQNFMGWARALSTMAAPDPSIADELDTSFCATDPAVIRQFADVAFMADTRQLLPLVRVPTLVVQCTDDVLVPVSVGEYLHEHIQGSRYALVDAVGHMPHMSVPDIVEREIRAFLAAA